MLSANADIESFTFPLVYEPGTSWKYSVGIDWVGILITRVSGMSLDAFFQQNLFQPCGIKDLTFFPREDMKSRMMSVCSRDPETGGLIKQDSLPMGRTDNPQLVGIHSGGGGLMGTLHDYLVLLQNVMKCSPNNPDPPKQPLLSKESFNLLFEPTLPIKQKFARDPKVGLADVPDTSREGHVAFMHYETYVHPSPTTETRNHSVAMSLNLIELESGRKAGSGTWGGAAKTQFWMDPTSGLVVSNEWGCVEVVVDADYQIKYCRSPGCLRNPVDCT
jgi:methyl acetate hydrolase